MRARTLPATRAAYEGKICAYCGEPARFGVYAFDDTGRVVATGYCCAEPTHWARLVESVDQLPEGDL
jgi:hypothetical protein